MSSNVQSLVNALSTDLNHRLGKGGRAEVRRADPTEPGVVFWKLAVRHLEPAGELGTGPDPDRSRKWALIVWCLAELGSLHRPGRHLGVALRQGGVSEMRVHRLLRSSGPPLVREIRSVIHQLASAGTSVDAADFAFLVLTDGTRAEDRIRYAVARDYFATDTVDA